MALHKKSRARVRGRRHSPLTDYFLPGAHNDFHPHFFRVKSVATIASIIILLFLIAIGLQNIVVRSPSPEIAAVIAAVLVDLANADRVENALPTLTSNDTLQRAAQLKADDMAARSYFAHSAPDGKTPWYWFKEAGYDFQFAGENLAVYFSDSAEVENAWMNSPTHRANILNSHFTEIGIALAHGTYRGVETTFVVQMFGMQAKVASAAVIESPAITGDSNVVAGASAESTPLEVIAEDETFIAVKGDIKAIAAINSEDPKPIGAIVAPEKSETTVLWKIISAPKTLLQYVYVAIAALIALALAFLAIEIRRNTLRHAFSGFGLLALIVFLLYGGMLISGSLVIL